MKKTQTIIFSLALVTALGLNAFALQTTKEEVKAFSSEITTDLVTTVQQKASQETVTTLENTDVDSQPSLIAQLGERVKIKRSDEVFMVRIPDELIGKLIVKEKQLNWIVRRGASPVDLPFIIFPSSKVTDNTMSFSVKIAPRKKVTLGKVLFSWIPSTYIMNKEENPSSDIILLATISTKKPTDSKAAFVSLNLDKEAKLLYVKYEWEEINKKHIIAEIK